MSVNSKMTALADEIRELSGTTTTKNIDTMITDVDVANTEISSQMNLINQITTALEGKASGGGTTIEAWTGIITILAPLGSGAPSAYYIDETLTTRILGGDGSRIVNETITIAANTPIFISMREDLILNNAEDITADNDINNWNCIVIRPTANNFSISN